MNLKNILAKINKARDAYIEKREKEAKRNLARFKTETARQREQLKLATERNKAREQAERAKAAAIKAETARKKAERELSRYGLKGQLTNLIRGLGNKPKRKRRAKR